MPLEKNLTYKEYPSTKKRKLNMKSQQANISTPNGIHIIEASAGTGKTHALTSIYLQKIIDGVPIKKIVTLTYTNAATDEMRLRIKSQLYKLMSILKRLNPKEKMQAQVKATTEEIKDHLIAYQLIEEIFRQKRQEEITKIKIQIAQAIDEIEQAEISTFHSFCERISNFYALEVGRIPNQQVGISERPFIENAATECWREKFCESTDPNGDVLYAYMANSKKSSNSKKPSNSKKILVNDFINYFDFIKTLLNRPSLKIYPENHLDENSYRQKKNELQEHFNRCRQEDFTNFFEKNSEELNHLLAWELENIASIVKKKSREEREKIRASSFDDLIFLCEELVQDEKIKSKINNRFEVLLVDEAQDCNERQLTLLEKMFPPQKKSITYIGDAKQSIYSFQGANVYSFLERRKKAANIKPLSINYRSDEALLHAIHNLYRECKEPFYFREDVLGYVETKAAKTDTEEIDRTASEARGSGTKNAAGKIDATIDEARTDTNASKAASCNEEEDKTATQIDGTATSLSKGSGASIETTQIDGAEIETVADGVNLDTTTLTTADGAEKNAYGSLTVFALDEKRQTPLKPNQRRTAILHKMAQEIISQKLSNDLNSTAVLVRQNKQIDEVASVLEQYNIPFQKLIDNQSVLLRPACKIISQLLLCLESMKLTAVKALLIELLHGFPTSDLIDDDENILNYFVDLKQFFEKNGIFSTVMHLLKSSGPTLKVFGGLRRQTIASYLIEKEGGQTLIEDLKFLAEILGREEIKKSASSFPYRTSGRAKELIKRLNILYKKALGGEKNHCQNNQRGNGIIIMTIHKSKGLEYDHVYLPTQTFRSSKTRPTIQIFYRESQWATREEQLAQTKQTTKNPTDPQKIFKSYNPYLCLVAGNEQKALCLEEEKKEDARLLYVALTRAKKKVSLFFCSNEGKNKASKQNKNFNNLLWKSYGNNATYHLFFHTGNGEINNDDAPSKTQNKFDYLEKLKEKSLFKKDNAALQAFTFEEVEETKLKIFGEAEPQVFLEAENQKAENQETKEPKKNNALAQSAQPKYFSSDDFSLKKITMRGYIESFTSLNKKLNLSTKKVAFSVESNEMEDQETQAPPEAEMEETKSSEPEFSFWALPSSAKIGEIFHQIIEGIEFDQVGKETHKKLILQRICHSLRLQNISERYSESFYNAVLSILNYPIGKGEDCNLPDDFSLTKISREDTLTEATFFYPCYKPLFAQEDGSWNNSYNVSSLGAPVDLLSTIAREFNKEKKQRITSAFHFQDHKPSLHFEQGYIKGVIDLVFRYNDRYFLLDWKTNRLGDKAKDYCSENIKNLMVQNAYTLQGKLYLIALHRLIKQRLGKRYDPNLHLGGVFFFFVRGAVFEEEATKCVYYFNLMKKQIEELEQNFCEAAR